MWTRALPALALLAAVATVAAGQEVGPEFRVNAYTTFDQDQSRVSADADGNFVVVWRSYGDGSATGVVGQRFDRLGTRLGSEFRINDYTSGYQSAPSITVAPSGAFIVAWQSQNQDGSFGGIFARRFDAAGTPLGLSEFRVNSVTTGDQRNANVAYAPGGDFVIVWESGGGQDGDSYGVFGRRFDSAGGALGPQFQVNTYTTSSQLRPVVAAWPGGFVVAWDSNGGEGNGRGVFARRYDSLGNATGPEFLVNSYTLGAQFGPRIAIDDSSEFVIVWTSYGPGGVDFYDVFGQRFDAYSRIGNEFLVNAQTTGAQGDPAVARDPSGEFLVAWSGTNGGSTDILAQRFDANAARIGDPFQVNSYTTGLQRIPAVAALGPDRFVVTWQSDQQPGQARDVFAQRFGDVLFRDGFESGDTSRWSAASSDGGDLGVTVGAAMKFTTFGLQALVDDTNGLFVQDDTPKDETTYRARFYFHPGDFDPGEGLSHFRTRIFIAFEEAPTRRLMALILRRIGGQYAVMGRVRRDDNTQADIGFFPIAAAAHFVEFRWLRATAPGADDGVFDLWIDGTPQGSLVAIDNDISSVDFVRLGALSVKTGASGTLYFDEFESRRETLIGP